jgi:hypothetical protein
MLFNESRAQNSFVVGFETPVLPPNSYLDGSDLTFTEFSENCAIFKTTFIVDTVFGFSYFGRDFARSNMKDTVDGSFMNLFSVISGNGANGSNQYAVGTQNFEGGARLRLANNCLNSGYRFSSVYVNNTTYAFKSMLYGDMFAKKFGGDSGNDPDFFILTIKGYLNGQMLNDSVNFYLADYRFTDNSLDYIVNEWTKVDLTASQVSIADSLEFFLSSSDNSAFGMNTPAFFAIDDLEVVNTTSAEQAGFAAGFSVFPNPASQSINVILPLEFYNARIEMIDMQGRIVQASTNVPQKTFINIQHLVPGMYVIKVISEQGIYQMKFIKYNEN